MKYLFLILALTACGKSPQTFDRAPASEPTPTVARETTCNFAPAHVESDAHTGLFSTTNYDYTNHSVTPNGKRIILIHGGAGVTTHKGWITGEVYCDLILKFRAAGYQVILFDRPLLRRELFQDDDGTNYRHEFEKKIRETVAWADSRLGTVSKQFVGGNSLGGFHSMMAVSLTGVFDAYFASFPVVNPNALAGFEDLSFANFNAMTEVSRLKNVSGHIAYGTGDEVVNYRLTIDLVNSLRAAGSNPVVDIYEGRGHEGVDDYDSVFSFLEGQ